MEQYQNALIAILGQLAILGITIYALLLMVGQGPKLANRFANWIIRSILESLKWAIKAPFKLLKKMIFSKSKKKKKRRR